MVNKDKAAQPTEKARKVAEDYKFFRKLTAKESPDGRIALQLLIEVSRDTEPGKAWQ